jgi:tRNA pseudouridine38-40 synthase
MKRLKLTIEYDGSRLNGWQIQAVDLSVQQVLQDAFAVVLAGQAVEVVGAGRTDSGVHALGQVAHVDLPPSFALNPANLYRLRASLNHFIHPHGVSVHDIEPVADDFHARFSAIRRRYCYRLHTHPALSPLHRHRVWHFGRPLDVPAMQQAAQFLLGQHDYSSFREICPMPGQNPDPQPGSSFGQRRWRIIIGVRCRCRWRARSFLHHQVRIMVGTLSPGRVASPTARMGFHRAGRRNRHQAGATRPARWVVFRQGLIIRQSH